VKRDLELDFIAAPPRVPAAGALLLAAGLLAAALAGGRFAALRDEARHLESRLDAVRADRPGRVQARGASPEFAADLTRARAVVGRLAAPWEEMFDELEAAVGGDVALLAVQPDLANARLTLTGEARALKQVVAFAARLNRGRAVGDALFTTHEVRLQDPQRPVRFTLEARWRSAERAR
jgi:Tfp pilus assembly protein PilN